MRARFLFPLIALTLLWLTAVPAADPGPEPASWLYTVRVFTLPRHEGMALLTADLEDSALYKRLMELTKDRPEILEKLIQVAGNGEDAVEVKLANELLHPTEFDPQQLPQKLVIGDSNLALALEKIMEPPDPPAPPVPPTMPVPTKTATDAPDIPSSPARAPTQRHPVNGGIGIITAITPTAFEMQPLGDVVELNPQPSPFPGDVNLQITCTSTRLAGFQDYNGEPQAMFSERTLNSKLKCSRNAPCFLGTFSTAQRTGVEFETKEPTLSLAFLAARRIPLPMLEGRTHPTNEDGRLMASLEVISLPKNAAVFLVDETLADAALYARLKAAIKDSSARLESFLSGAVASGKNCVMADADSLTYPTEFDPPQLVSNLLIGDDALLADLRAGRDIGTGAAPNNASPHNGGFGLMTRVTPTAFQTRGLGTKLDLEVVRKDRFLAITAKPQLSRQIGESTYNDTKHPLIEAMSLSASPIARAGVTCFLGTLNRPLNTGVKEGNQEDRTWFAFLTVREQ